MSDLERQIFSSLWDLMQVASSSYDEYRASVVCPSTGAIDADDRAYLDELDAAIGDGMRVLVKAGERWRATSARIPAELAVQLILAQAWQAARSGQTAG